MKLKKGDKVVVITGKDKGKEGKIVRVLVSENKVVLDGLNMMKKHSRPRKANEKGSVIEVAMPINASNVMVVDPKTGARTRVGSTKIDGKNVRVTKKSGS